MLDPDALGALKALDEQSPGEVAAIVRMFLTETRSRLDGTACLAALCGELEEAFAAATTRSSRRRWFDSTRSTSTSPLP